MAGQSAAPYFLLAFVSLSCFIISSLFISQLTFAYSAPVLLRVATYNLRYDNADDGTNAWPNRKEMVKNLVRYHDFDIFGTQEGLQGQLTSVAELPEYA